MRNLIAFAATATAACTAGISDHPPEVSTASLVVAEDVAAPLAITASDRDGDRIALEFDDPAHGVITVVAGGYTYTPDPDFDGADLVVVRVGDGRHQVRAEVPVQVIGVNDAPRAGADGIATDEDYPVSAPLAMLLGNDRDPEGQPVQLARLGTTLGGTVQRVGDELRFAPRPDWVGTAGFGYTITDGELESDGWVTVTVGGINDAPAAATDAVTTREDEVLDIGDQVLVANDVDRDGQRMWVDEVSGAIGGTVALAGGRVSFTPARDHHGAAGFAYTVTDGAAASAGWVDVTIAAVTECGDHDVDATYQARAVELSWLATSCDGPNQITFSINGVEVLTTEASSGESRCTCDPGIRTVTLTDPDLLAMIDGNVDFNVHVPGATLLAWARADVRDATSSRAIEIYDHHGGGDALANRANLCEATACEDTLAWTRVAFGEQCDDGNAIDGDGCDLTCQRQ